MLRTSRSETRYLQLKPLITSFKAALQFEQVWQVSLLCLICYTS